MEFDSADIEEQYELNLDNELLLNIRNRHEQQEENLPEYTNYMMNVSENLLEAANVGNLHTSIDQSITKRNNAKSEITTASHRFLKTRKNKMNTSVKKMISVNRKLTAIHEKQQDKTSLYSWNEKLASFEDVYSSIREADRYFAESYANTKEEETVIKLRADLVYYQNMVYLYGRERNSLSVQLEELQNKKTEMLNDETGKFSSTAYKNNEVELENLTDKHNEMSRKETNANKKYKEIKEKLDKFNAANV